MTIQLTVIGLNQIGVSIGLALQEKSQDITRIGNDADYLLEQKTQRLRAFDRVEHNLPTAVKEADIIVLSLPVDEIQKTIGLIAPYLKPGAVVLETSVLNNAPITWGIQMLPPERYLISFIPTLNPGVLHDLDNSIESARADLFINSSIIITADCAVHPDALQLAADLASLLKAKPIFADPLESDGLVAAVDLLPKLTALAFLQAVSSQPGWRESRKMAGKPFVSVSEPALYLDEVTEYGLSTLLNSDNTTRMLDALILELQTMREFIADNDAAMLKKMIDQAQAERLNWWKHRQGNDWEDHGDAPELPTTGQMLGKIFLGSRRKPKNTGRAK